MYVIHVFVVFMVIVWTSGLASVYFGLKAIENPVKYKWVGICLLHYMPLAEMKEMLKRDSSVKLTERGDTIIDETYQTYFNVVKWPIIAMFLGVNWILSVPQLIAKLVQR